MIPVAIAILALSVVVNLILFRLYTRRYRDEIDNLTCELDRLNVYRAELQRRCERMRQQAVITGSTSSDYWQNGVICRIWWN